MIQTVGNSLKWTNLAFW